MKNLKEGSYKIEGTLKVLVDEKGNKTFVVTGKVAKGVNKGQHFEVIKEDYSNA